MSNLPGVAERLGRRARWEIHLVAFANGHLGRPYVWGETDCAALVRGAVAEMFDPSPLADVPAYATLAEAVRALQVVGDVVAYLEARGATAVPVAFAQAGDVVLLPGDDGDGLPRLGIVVDGRAKLLTSHPEHGVEVVPLRVLPEGCSAWRW